MSIELLIHRFVEVELAQRDADDEEMAKKESIRDIARRLKTITEAQLNRLFGDYYQNELSKNAQKRVDKLGISDDKDNLNDAFIKAFEKETGMNVVRRNPMSSLFGAFVTLVGAFAVAAVAMFAFEMITASAVMPVFLSMMPFLAVLGPVGGVLTVAAAIGVAALLVYGLVLAITAGATSKNVHVVRPGEDAEVAMEEGFGSDNELERNNNNGNTLGAHHRVGSDSEAQQQRFTRTQPPVPVSHRVVDGAQDDAQPPVPASRRVVAGAQDDAQQRAMFELFLNAKTEQQQATSTLAVAAADAPMTSPVHRAPPVPRRVLTPAQSGSDQDEPAVHATARSASQ